MLNPAFFGLYNAQRGIIAAQTALNVVGHNITNANTPGYSRQTANLSSYVPYVHPNLSQVAAAGQSGQGVVVTSITRARMGVLDDHFRSLNSQVGMDSAIQENLKLVESYLAETDDGGLNKTIQNFFASAQELSVHPESIPARNAYLRSAEDMVNAFNQRANQLQDIKDGLVSSTQPSELQNSVAVANQKLQEIADLNREILAVTSVGGQPNDLMDKRDLALDELSKQTDFTITNLPNNQIDVVIGGVTMVGRINVLNTLQVVANPGPAPPTSAVPSLVQTTGTSATVVLNDGAGGEITSGRIRGILDAAGNTGSTTSVQSVIEDLDNIISSIVQEVNALQVAGRDLNGNLGTGNEIFTPATPVVPPLGIFQYTINAAVKADPTLVAAAINDPAAPPGPGFAGPGDARNAVLIAQLRTKTIATAYTALPALGTTFEEGLNDTISTLGVDTSVYNARVAANGSLRSSVDQNRQSVSGVNMDEELVDMLRFQRAFEASSKMINVYDEIVQGILNLI